MRRLAIVAALSFVGCTQILDLDDAVVVPPERTVTVPPFEGVLVDAGREDVDATPDVASNAPEDAKD